ncbi:hypothetical protein A2U01_0047544, partial [Trifolium medium]|nr:hypothetical protein [Trifolium medium]
STEGSMCTFIALHRSMIQLNRVVVLAKWLSFPNMQIKGLGGLANFIK